MMFHETVIGDVPPSKNTPQTRSELPVSQSKKVSLRGSPRHVNRVLPMLCPCPGSSKPIVNPITNAWAGEQLTFRQRAVELARQKERPVAQIAKGLGIS